MEESEEVVLNLPEDIHKLCRTCLTVLNDGMSVCHEVALLNEYNMLSDVSEMLQRCSAIKVQ